MNKKKWMLCLGMGLAFLACLVLFLLMLTKAGGTASTTPGSSTQDTSAATTTQFIPPTTTEAQEIPLEFGYRGDYLTCLTRESMLGIDVSSFQKEINWEKVKQAGIAFVMIRIGFRGYGEKGVLCEDKQAAENYRQAKAAGLKIGGYFFSQALSTEEAEEEADYVLSLIKDWELDMPLVFDWECHSDEYRTANVDARTLTDCTVAFCEAIKTAGYRPMIYYNPDQSPKEMFLQELTGYDFWLGQYGQTLQTTLPVAMWQYTNEGSVPGISGNVDINLFFTP